jgi:hypothetical protein
MKRTRTGRDSRFEARRSRCFTAALVLLAIASAPTAWAYTCTGTISAVSLAPSGLVTISSATAGLNSVYLCAIGTSDNGVSSDACKAIVAVVTAAKTNGGQVTWWFSDSLTCTTHPGSNWLTGWYAGPQLQ